MGPERQITITALMMFMLMYCDCRKQPAGFENVDIISYRGETAEKLLFDIGLEYIKNYPHEEDFRLDGWEFYYPGGLVMIVHTKDLKYCEPIDTLGYFWKLDDFKKESIWCVTIKACQWYIRSDD